MAPGVKFTLYKQLLPQFQFAKEIQTQNHESNRYILLDMLVGIEIVSAIDAKSLKMMLSHLKVVKSGSKIVMLLQSGL